MRAAHPVPFKNPTTLCPNILCYIYCGSETSPAIRYRHDSVYTIS
jgi:hypothetical protein